MTQDVHPRSRPGWLLLGPAFVAAIAYVDPGNVAANVSAGAQFGFLLVWVIVLANLMAYLVQYLSAKLGLATGLSLPQAVGDRLGRPSRLAYWIQAELVAMATDLAEVVGGAIALYLLFVVKDRRGQQTFERVIIGLLMIIAIGFLTSLVAAPPSIDDVAAGLIPRFDGAESVLLAAAMLGATVMPHAVYLHSGLARDRHGHPEPGPMRRRLLRATRWDVGIAMLLAGAVNLSMLLIAATNLQGMADTDSIEGAYHAVESTLGYTVALLFAIGLLASGLASSSVGAYAGAMIMQGLLRRSIPLVARRVITLLPALAILAVGVDPSRALVLSQVVLSFGIPFALIPLVRLTANARLMGTDANHGLTTALGWAVAGVISVLNVVLIYLTVKG